MEDAELKNIWQSYDKKIAEAQLLNAQSWALNLQCFETIRQQKAGSKLYSLVRFKITGVVLGIAWILFLALLVAGNHFMNPYFSGSVSIILGFSLYAVVAYIRQVVQIRQINFEGNITNTQKRLAALQLSTLQSTRLLWLQMPFYTTFFWSKEWMSSDPNFWRVAFPISLLFTILAIFLYKNINQENMHKEWVRKFMMMGPEYKNLVQAAAFIGEIDEFKKELIIP